MTNSNTDDYSRVEVPLNVTLLGDKVGYRIDSLDRLKQALSDLASWTETSSPEELRSFIEELTLPALFNLMITSNQDEHLIRSVKKICSNYLATLPNSFLLRDELFPFLMIGLESSEPHTTTLALEQLLRLDPHNLATINNAISHHIIKHVASSSIMVSEVASEVFLKISASSHFEEFLNTPEIISSIQSFFNSSSSVRFIQLFFKVIATSSENASDPVHVLDKMGLMSPLFTGLNTGDLLIKLNILEIYSEFSNCPKIYEIMRSVNIFSQVLESLQNKLRNSEFSENAEEKIICSSELSFLALSLKSNSEPDFIDNFLKLIEGFILLEDCPDIQIATLSTIAKIVENNFVLSCVLEFPTILDQITSLFYNSSPIINQEALACIAISIESRGQLDDILTQFSQKTIYLLQEKGNFIERIIKLTYDPEEKTKGSAYALLHHLSYYTFGTQIIIQEPKIMNFLLDRSLDSTPLAQKWKYGIAESLLKKLTTSEFSNSNISENPNFILIQNNLKKFVADGVFYTKASSHVALDSI